MYFSCLVIISLCVCVCVCVCVCDICGYVWFFGGVCVGCGVCGRVFVYLCVVVCVCMVCVVCVYVYDVKYVCICGVWEVCVGGVVLGGSVGVYMYGVCDVWCV